MPRAMDYRLAARNFRSRRDRLAEAGQRDRSVPTLTAVGPVAEYTDAAQLRLRQLFLTASAEFDALAGVCDRRADVCAAFAAELAAYERLDVWERIWVPRPRPPAAWVDV